MKPHPPALITESRAEAFTASAWGFVCWLFGVIVKLGLTGRSRKLRDMLHRAEHAVELTLFLRAVARFGPLPKKKHRPASAPHGFRMAPSRLKLFFKRANIRARKASAIERMFTLIEALQDPKPAIAYFLKRLRNGLRGRRLVLVAPISDTFLSALALFPQTALDSS